MLETRLNPAPPDTCAHCSVVTLLCCRVWAMSSMLIRCFGSDPVLFYRDDVGGYVKMDIRYILLLKCVQPLKLYANRVFWLRFANK